MQCFNYLQMCLVLCTVYGDIIHKNFISNSASDSRSIEIGNTSRIVDMQSVISLGKPRRQFKVSPKFRRHKKNRRQKIGGLSIPNFISQIYTEGYRNLNITTSTPAYLVDSLEQEQKTTKSSAATPYLEVFTRATRTSVGNATTVSTITWSYQGNKSSEESDESKSTLIDYPFSVSIQKKGAHYASGALLNKFWVITSAGEFYHVRESLKLFRVRLGSVDCKSGGTIIPIKKIEIHPYYIYKMPNFDVALLRMAMYVDYNTFIRPIAISKIKGKLLSAKFMTTYWPRILVKGNTLPHNARERLSFNSMRVSTQRLIPDRECAELMKNVSVVLHECSLCLKPVVTHHSVCMPDVGAPVIAEDGLWGITSGWVSPLCPQVAGPTLFTRLSSSSVRAWLDSHIL